MQVPPRCTSVDMIKCFITLWKPGAITTRSLKDPPGLSMPLPWLIVRSEEVLHLIIQLLQGPYSPIIMSHLHVFAWKGAMKYWLDA